MTVEVTSSVVSRPRALVANIVTVVNLMSNVMRAARRAGMNTPSSCVAAHAGVDHV
jgi:transcription termination factor Rho